MPSGFLKEDPKLQNRPISNYENFPELSNQAELNLIK